MHHLSSLSRLALSFVLLAALAASVQSFAPTAFANCGTNAGGGNCKKAAPRKPSVPDGWTIVQTVVAGLRYSIWI